MKVTEYKKYGIDNEDWPYVQVDVWHDFPARRIWNLDCLNNEKGRESRHEIIYIYIPLYYMYNNLKWTVKGELINTKVEQKHCHLIDLYIWNFGSPLYSEILWMGSLRVFVAVYVELSRHNYIID